MQAKRTPYVILFSIWHKCDCQNFQKIDSKTTSLHSVCHSTLIAGNLGVCFIRKRVRRLRGLGTVSCSTLVSWPRNHCLLPRLCSEYHNLFTEFKYLSVLASVLCNHLKRSTDVEEMLILSIISKSPSSDKGVACRLVVLLCFGIYP